MSSSPDERRSRVPICLIASNGGHLTQLITLLEGCQRWGCSVVTAYDDHLREFAESQRTFFVTDFGRNGFRLIRNVLEAFHLILREWPRVVITTGAGIAVPICYWAKLLGARVMYVETISRVNMPSLTGRALHPIADHFFVQWPELVGSFAKAEFRGALL